MMWTYLFVYSEELAMAGNVRKFIDNHPNIYDWHSCLPNSYFLVSDLTASGLSDSIKQRFGKRLFIVVDTQTDRNGWLPKSVWKIMPDGLGVA